MSEREELNRRLDAYHEALSKKVRELRAEAQSYNDYLELLTQQRGILDLYGARMPAVMQAAELIIQEIAAATRIELEVSVENPLPSEDTPRLPTVSIGGRIPTLRPRTRRIAVSTPTERDLKKGTYYNIAPVVKPIMNAIFGSGKEGIPENLDSLFENIYGQDWRSKRLRIPTRPGERGREITYGDDLLSGNSYLKRLVRGADEVINTKMRENSTPSFEMGRKIAAPELVQLFHIIGSVGWDVYDGFMIRNGIRQT